MAMEALAIEALVMEALTTEAPVTEAWSQRRVLRRHRPEKQWPRFRR